MEEINRLKVELINTKVSKEKPEGAKKAMKKLGNLSAQNLNKRMERRDQEINTLEKEKVEQAETIFALEKKIHFSRLTMIHIQRITHLQKPDP